MLKFVIFKQHTVIVTLIKFTAVKAYYFSDELRQFWARNRTYLFLKLQKFQEY